MLTIGVMQHSQRDFILARGRRRRLLRAEPAGFRLARQRAGLTQAEIAELLGVDQAAVSRWESGKRIPRGKTLDRYAELLEELDQ